MLSTEEFILFVVLQSAGVLAIGCVGKTREKKQIGSGSQLVFKQNGVV